MFLIHTNSYLLRRLKSIASSTLRYYEKRAYYLMPVEMKGLRVLMDIAIQGTGIRLYEVYKRDEQRVNLMA